MTTLTVPSPLALEAPPDASRREQRFVLSEMSWPAYLAIGNTLIDRPAVRLTYDQGKLELMTTSPEHEIYKQRLGRLLETLAEELELPILPGGNTTFQREDLDRGLEPDQCYWIAREKQMRTRLQWDGKKDPPPDLAVEIEVSRSSLNRLGIYAALGVPEVWRFDGAELRAQVLQPDRSYQTVEVSPTFPGIPLAGIVAFLRPSETMDYLGSVRAFRAWVRAQLPAPPAAPAP